MGSIGNILKPITNLVGNKDKKVDAPTVALNPDEEKKKAALLKSVLTETSGGVLGQEAQSGAVSRSNVFGN